jgi:hypothetical protein
LLIVDFGRHWPGHCASLTAEVLITCLALFTLKARIYEEASFRWTSYAVSSQLTTATVQRREMLRARIPTIPVVLVFNVGDSSRFDYSYSSSYNYESTACTLNPSKAVHAVSDYT